MGLSLLGKSFTPQVDDTVGVKIQDLFLQLLQILVQLKEGPSSGERSSKNICCIAWNDFFLHFTHIDLHDIFSADSYIVNVVSSLVYDVEQLTRTFDCNGLRLVWFLTKFAPKARIKK